MYTTAPDLVSNAVHRSVRPTQSVTPVPAARRRSRRGPEVRPADRQRRAPPCCSNVPLLLPFGLIFFFFSMKLSAPYVTPRASVRSPSRITRVKALLPLQCSTRNLSRPGESSTPSFVLAFSAESRYHRPPVVLISVGEAEVPPRASVWRPTRRVRLPRYLRVGFCWV